MSEEVLLGLSKFPHVPPPVDASKSVTSIVDKYALFVAKKPLADILVLEALGNIHVICGRPEGEEGYGGSVMCPQCDLSSRRDVCDTMRARIERIQERQQERMLTQVRTSSSKPKWEILSSFQYLSQTRLVPSVLVTSWIYNK